MRVGLRPGTPVGHDRRVDEGHSIDLSDNRSRVVTHGMTPKGLRVQLVAWHKDLSPDTPSPYEDWPEGEREMPRGLGRYLVEVQLPALVNAGPAELYIGSGDQQSNRVRIWIEP